MKKNDTSLYVRAGKLLVAGGIFTLIFLFPALGFSQITVTITGTDVSCYGDNDGSATAAGSGGTAPYSYLWSNGNTSASISNLTAGTYSVTVTDSNQASAVGSVAIDQPDQLGVQAYGDSQICGVAPDGKATAVPFGGTPPYTYLWSNGGTTAQITGLTAGTYTVTVTDANDCTASASAVVYYWNEGIWLMDSTADVSCFGLNDGFAHISAMTGTPPYTYIWTTGDTTADVFNLPPGDYTVTVTDVNGCSNFWSVTISQPTELLCEVTSVPGVCGLSGTATVNPSGGTPPYSILWSTGATGLTITAPPGDYSVTVTDANDCSCSSDVTIGSTSDSLIVSATATSSAGCTIGGSATASAIGGSGNYAFSWDNGQASATATNLTAGNHTVTVTDIATGCPGTATVNIPSAPQLTATATLEMNATCLIGGSATASATGGTPPYMFNWDNGQTTATATNLNAGPHSVTITDSKGCIASASVTIGQNQGPTVTIEVNSNATCTTGGSATANASGGAGGYMYFWDNNQTTAMATGLTAGPHSVTVTDAAGCSATGSVTITQPDAPILQVTNVINAGCTGSGGSATVAASGGTAPYSYLWNNGATTATASNLTPGTYSVTATDAAMCSASVTVTIATAVPPNVVITASSNATCDQPGSATASATGGGGSYTYLWDNNETTATAVNLTDGPHSVTVTDANGCTASASVTIGFTSNGVKIGDYVWYDDDQNGAQHMLETGVPDIKVKLITAGPDGQFNTSDDLAIDSTTTNANGLYSFECVTPGTYVLMFSGLATGYEFADKDKVNNDCKDSDVKPNGKTEPFDIIAGQTDNLCLDAGIHIFCDNVLSAGLICCNQTICEGETPALITNLQWPSGGTGPIEYQWLQLVQMGPAPPNWVAIPGATNSTYQPGPLTQTAYYMRCARRQGCITFLESNIVTITVNPAGSPGCDDFTMDLEARVTGNSNVMVEWTTTLPEFTAYIYTVEHATDMVNWDAISTFTGLHDATKPNHYSVMHQTPVVGKNYYRVRRSNAGGVTSYSQIRSVELDRNAAESVAVYPNPASAFLVIKNVRKYDADVSVQLINTVGDVLNSLTIKKETLHYEELPVEDLPSGIYMVRIRFGSGEVRTVKITKI